MMDRLLFLGVGRRVELLRRFEEARDSLGFRRCLEIVATDADTDAPALKHADRAVILPPLSDARHASALNDLCDVGGRSAVFPLIDPYVPVAAGLTRPDVQGWTLDLERVSVAGDKWLTYGFFLEHGIPTPETALPTGPELPLPTVIKPRAGSAGENVFVARSDAELKFFLSYVPDPLVQRFVEAPEVTIDIVCAPGGGLLGLGMRRRLKVRAGEVAVAETIWNEAIAEACRRIVTALRPNGPITAQCFLTEEGPWFTEINGRFGGGIPLSLRAGMDVIDAICTLAIGGDIGPAEPLIAASGWRMARFDEAYYEGPND